MIIQEPVQASIWHCLNNYDYKDAIFLAERLFAEVESNETLFLLATCYFRSGQKSQTYFTLKSKPNISPQCRYLLAICAYELGKYAEAEATLKENTKPNCNVDEFIAEYGDQTSFVLLLLGRLAAKTERKNKAIEYWRHALKLNPFLWSSFEELCKIGEKPNAQNAFQLSNLDNLSMCHGHNLNNIETAIIPETIPENEGTPKELIGFCLKTPQQPLLKLNSPTNTNNLCTPDNSPLGNPLVMSGLAPIPSLKYKPLRFRLDQSNSLSPSFGYLLDTSLETTTPKLSQQTLMESNNFNQFPKRLKAQDILFRKESILQNSKHQGIIVPMTNKTPSQNVRRSSRLFSNSYSVKENNTSPNRNKFVTPKSPTKKTKQRVPKYNLNKSNYHEINTRNMKIEKEKIETVTSEVKAETGTDVVSKATMIQKHSAEGLMTLLRTMGQAFLELSVFQCKQAIETLNTLPKNQFETLWVQCHLGLAHYELSEYEKSIKHFQEVHIKHPHQLDFMDIYSTCLWHLQKEVQLSALAQDLVKTNEYSPVTWCVSGNCMSLHKEHDSAIKFFQRAVQVDPTFTYAFTLLGHEFITTEELDKAMNCFRNAIRLDPRHYNAWFGIGTIYSKQERYHLAEMNFSRALSINPRSSIILCHIGIVQHALKESEKALNTLDIAVYNNPRSPLCKFHRGSIYFSLGRHTEALKELEELKQIVPKESLVYYLIGKVHKKLGNTDLALMYFSWATDLDPKGASNQIKAAFDPPARGRADENETPSSPSFYQSEGPFGQQAERNNYANLPEDSDTSF